MIPRIISAWIIGEVTWNAKYPSNQRTTSIIPMINTNLLKALNFKCEYFSSKKSENKGMIHHKKECYTTLGKSYIIHTFPN
jgi:hypothetical protein